MKHCETSASFVIRHIKYYYLLISDEFAINFLLRDLNIKEFINNLNFPLLVQKCLFLYFFISNFRFICSMSDLSTFFKSATLCKDR